MKDIKYKRMYEICICPNYLGEFIEWLSWAIMTFSNPGLCSSLDSSKFITGCSKCNWYKESFDDYPKERKAVIPGLL